MSVRRKIGEASSGSATAAREADVVVIGAGFFGCEIALAMRGLGFDRVVSSNANDYPEPRKLRKSSACPQRLSLSAIPGDSATVAQNFERFLVDYSYAIHWSMQMVYAIAHGSKVNPTQFERVCATIGAPCASAPGRLERLFDPDLIDAVFSRANFPSTRTKSQNGW